MAETMECPHCATTTKYGVNFCTGCQAEVKYTRRMGGMLAGTGFGVLMVLAGVNKGEIGMILLGVIVAGIGGYFVFRKMKNPAIPIFTRKRR